MVWSLKNIEIKYDTELLKLEKVHGKTKIDCGSLCLEKKLNLLITADIKKPLIKSLKPNNSMD